MITLLSKKVSHQFEKMEKEAKGRLPVLLQCVILVAAFFDVF